VRKIFGRQTRPITLTLRGVQAVARPGRRPQETTTGVHARVFPADAVRACGVAAEVRLSGVAKRAVNPAGDGVSGRMRDGAVVILEVGQS